MLTHFGVTGVVMFGYIFGILSLANWRLTPIVCTGILVCVAMMKQVKISIPLRRIAVIAGCVFVLFGAVSVKEIKAMPQNGITENQYYDIACYLESKGLDYGYASFWKSQTITVITDSRVKVANTDLDDRGITPCAFQANMNWFEMQNGVDRYFLLMDKNEYLTVMGTDDSVHLLVSPVEVIHDFEGYVILIYEDTQFLK